MTFPAVIRGRINPSFHGRLVGAEPITADKSGLTYTIGLDISTVSETTSVPDLTAFKALVRVGDDNEMTAIPLSDLPSGATSWDDIQDKPTLLPETRQINTTAPLTGGGDLSADRTLSLTANGITYDLIQQVAASKLLGNATGSTANAAEIGLTSGHLAFSGSNIGLANTAVSAGSYTNASITVDAQGRLTAASSGSVSGLQITRMTRLTLSGTEQGWTTIPAGTFKIDLGFEGISTNGTALPLIQLGDSGGYETSGYIGADTYLPNGAANVSAVMSSGFALTAAMAATMAFSGNASLFLSDTSANTWTFSSNTGRSDAAVALLSGGHKSLSATLDRIRIITANGTDTFDAGAISAICWHT